MSEETDIQEHAKRLWADLAGVRMKRIRKLEDKVQRYKEALVNIQSIIKTLDAPVLKLSKIYLEITKEGLERGKSE